MKLHVYTGDGKGKTTAALGLALRSLGHGHSVLFAQFMKDGTSGELSALATFPTAVVRIAPVSGFSFHMTQEEKAACALKQTAFAHLLENELRQLHPQLIILDELNCALSSGFVSETDGKHLIHAALSVGETVVTGRNAPAYVMDMADYISVIQAVRHPYATQQLPAREGIEY